MANLCKIANLLCNVSIDISDMDVGFFMIIPFIIFAVIAIIVGSVISKRVKEAREAIKKQHQQQSYGHQSTYTDGNGRTQIQTEYINSLRRKVEQKRADLQAKQRSSVSIKNVEEDDHEHLGEVETYDQIVGSLGDVNDEGCPELDGVRLLAEDIAYDTDDNEHRYDYGKIAQAMVLGDIVNTPRFKQPHGKK